MYIVYLVYNKSEYLYNIEIVYYNNIVLYSFYSIKDDEYYTGTSNLNLDV